MPFNDKKGDETLKYNLRNHPRTHAKTKGSEMSCYEWARGFEAELREKLASKELINAQDHDETLQWAMKYRNAIIKEILGEKTIEM